MSSTIGLLSGPTTLGLSHSNNGGRSRLGMLATVIGRHRAHRR